MKRIWIAVTILFLLVAACSFSIKNTEVHTERMISLLTELKTAARETENTQAVSLCEALSAQWEQSRRSLCSYISHARLEAIEDTLSILPTLLQCEQYTQIQTECDRTTAQLQHLLDTEKILLENIL